MNTGRTPRQNLVDLVGAAPSGLEVLAAVVLALFDRWQLATAIQALDDCTGWSDDQLWNLRAAAWIAHLRADLADAAVDNALLDDADPPAQGEPVRRP